jgi:hypothetical protein
MPTELPEDMRGDPIPALCLKDSGGHSISVTATSARNATAMTDTKIVSLYATVDVFLKLGDDTVVATTSDHFFPAGVYYDIHIKDNTHIAAIRASSDGTLYISEKE